VRGRWLRDVVERRGSTDEGVDGGTPPTVPPGRGAGDAKTPLGTTEPARAQQI
jgi:hypothetical protein